VLAIVGMADRLQGLLDAEAARIRFLAGRALLVLRPVRELTGREAAHAIDLIVADLERFLRPDENKRRIRRPQRLGEALSDTGESALAIIGRHINNEVSRAD